MEFTKIMWYNSKYTSLFGYLNNNMILDNNTLLLCSKILTIVPLFNSNNIMMMRGMFFYIGMYL